MIKIQHKLYAIAKAYWHVLIVMMSKFFLFVGALCVGVTQAYAVTQEFNSNGGVTSTDGLHFYIDDSTQLQVRRLNNTGQVYDPTVTPFNSNLDNGIYLRAGGQIYGPSHFAFTSNAYSTKSISTVTPANPASIGDLQMATSSFGVNLGPQLTVVWKYTKPFDFITAEVTVVIPATYAVSVTNPVRYYHVVDTFLGGSDNGCGVRYTDANGKLVVGTYPSTSGTCASSTSIPSGVSVVESFRERSGAFSNYCVSAWDAFWDTSIFFRNGCSIANTNDLTNTISTSYQDTGVGIEYKFTAAGTYTFSYDFVVGTTTVPSYDHFEIRHPGTSSLCPATLTVLACTSNTVPCPVTNIINTGTLTGSIKNTPASPAITQTPASFTLGSIASTATVTFQGSGAGTYNLSGSGLSATPLNGTKCWNTATNTASCSFTVTNTPCVSGFECLETGLTYNNLVSSPISRNPLYTKIAGAGFSFDVVAIQSSGAVASGYTASSGVTVELYDDSVSPRPACNAYSSPLASQAVTFAAADSGRKTLTNFTLANAYRKLRCRVKDSALSVYGCSSDNFSVRPANISVSTSNANADLASGANVSASPAIKTGASFSLTASTSVVGYDGTPAIESSKLNAHTGSVQVGSLGGTFSAANAATGNSTGAGFNYSEVGYFRLSANGVYDSTFTVVDSANGDCAIGFTASGGKNACSFGNSAATSYFGRFIPDHFVLTTGVTMTACGSSFSYFGQDGFSTAFTLTAQNSENITTQNYAGGFAKLGLTSWGNYNFSASLLPAGSSLSASATAPTGTWINGTADISAKHQISRPTSATAPSNISVSAAPVDADGVTMTRSAVSSASSFRFGRLLMPNIYGSELLPLTVPIEAQYWNGTAYQRNQLDTCTAIPTNAVAMGNYKNNLGVCETSLTGGGAMAAGKTAVKLSAPGIGNHGSVDLSLNLNSASGLTCTPSSASATSAGIPWFGTNPNARATFGLFKSPVIYMRENY